MTVLRLLPADLGRYPHGMSADLASGGFAAKAPDRIVTIDEFFVTLRGPANLSRRECDLLRRQVLFRLRRLVAELQTLGSDIDTD
jgi:hypothetical protein